MQWPYSASPSELGIIGKPVVMGEFPVNGLTGVPYSQMLESWYGNGYAGALGWAVNGGGSNPALSWSMGKAAVKTFADAKGCRDERTRGRTPLPNPLPPRFAGRGDREPSVLRGSGHW